jgi:hypothetical protein
METVRRSTRFVAVLRAAKGGLKMGDFEMIPQGTAKSVIEAQVLQYEDSTKMFMLSDKGEQEHAFWTASRPSEFYVQLQTNTEERQGRIAGFLANAAKRKRLFLIAPVPVVPTRQARGRRTSGQ